MKSEAAKSVLVGAAFVAALIGLWEWLGATGEVALTAVLPPPSRFFQTVIDSGFKIGLGGQAAPVWESVASTLGRVFVGMSLAFVGAVLSGALLSLSKVATWCLRPVLHILAPIAPIAWIPTAIV
ncbi:MAG: nitrate ABC transporter permease, partial [Pseudomonadota bacterium]